MPLLCKLRGHKWESIVHTRVTGETRRFCLREQKWITVANSWDDLNQGGRRDA